MIESKTTAELLELLASPDWGRDFNAADTHDRYRVVRELARRIDAGGLAPRSNPDAEV